MTSWLILSHKLTGEHKVSIVTEKDADGLFVVRHSTAHVLCSAASSLWKRPTRTASPINRGLCASPRLPCIR